LPNIFASPASTAIDRTVGFGLSGSEPLVDDYRLRKQTIDFVLGQPPACKGCRSLPIIIKSKLLIFATIFVLGSAWYASSSWNSCPGSWRNSETWNNCVGSVKFTDGDKLSSRFENGKIVGNATYAFANGDSYVGEVPKLSGVGDVVKLSGNGTYYYSNGSKYVGELVDGQFDGAGTLFYLNGDR